MWRAPVAALALALAGCGSEEAVTTTITATQATTVQETTTVSVTTTVAETVTVQTPLSGPGADPDDVAGELDLERLTATRAGDVLHVTLTTYESWPASTLQGSGAGRPGPTRLTLLFDTDLDGAPEFTGRAVYLDDAGLALWIRGRGQSFEPVPALRADEASIEVTFPVDAMFLDEDSEVDMQIAAASRLGGVRDRAPDSGWLLVPYF
jgi:hypothetical protein